MPKWQESWFYDSREGGPATTSTRAHIPETCGGISLLQALPKTRRKSPLLTDFADGCCPAQNARNPKIRYLAFAGPFRVQGGGRGTGLPQPDKRIVAKNATNLSTRIRCNARSHGARGSPAADLSDNYCFGCPRTDNTSSRNAVPPLLHENSLKVVHGLLPSTRGRLFCRDGQFRERRAGTCPAPIQDTRPGWLVLPFCIGSVSFPAACPGTARLRHRPAKMENSLFSCT